MLEKKQTYSFKALPSTVNKARKKAFKENRSLSGLITILLEKYVEPFKKATP